MGLKLGLEKDLLVSVVRAIAQLAAVAGAIHLVFDSLGLSGVVLIVMLAAATWTSARRMRGVPGAAWVALAVISAAAGVALAVLFGAGVFELAPKFLIPIAGMLIGNSMTAASVAGSRMRDEIVDKTLEVEARLALGVRARSALNPYLRGAVTTSMIPIIDSTKNVGLIFLPGAFVGMILGGATPADAARVQLIVLFMLLGAVAVAGMGAAVLVAARFVAEGERIVIPEELAR